MSQTGNEGGSPGRYQRSANGLVASLVVTVLAVVGFVIFRSVFSEDLEVGPEPVDYLETVSQLQDSDVDAVYPAQLPDGWIVSAVDFAPGQRPELGLSIFTDDEKFIGIRQADRSANDLLAELVDADRVDYEPAYDATRSVASTWEGWSDEGGDLAYVATVGADTVIVFGSAPEADLREVVDSLTTDPVSSPAG